jgi:hypothetical protein
MTSQLADVLAQNAGLTARLLRDHRDRGDGRCRLCLVGNQSGHQPWPCTLYAAAERAVHLAQAARRRHA